MSGIEFISVCLKGGYLDNRLREKFIDCKTLFEFAFSNYTTYYKNMQGNFENIEENSSPTLTPDATPKELTPLKVEEEPQQNNSQEKDHSVKLILIISAIVIVIIVCIILIIEKKKSKLFQRRKR
ncbi:MAG: hypothetical protein HFJ50_06040 [Clostridia bacterium]|jgi:hypothetical protein|nr:hypothetical protein [Clostridia bacterium]